GQEEGNDEFLKNMKTLKKISFLRLETLKKWFENDSSENFCKQFYEKAKEDGEAYKNLFKQRVKGVNSVSRAENGAVPFYRGETFYDEGVFLWFLVNFEDGGKAEFKKAVDALCEVGGFGGELNLGYGRVKKEEEKLPFNEVTAGFSENKKNLLLSLASQSGIGSENLEGESYDLVLRKGYIAHSSQRKNPVWCFREGSVFTKFPLSGEIFKVGEKGDYAVYRDLRAFWVNF
ncbi:hypothetical protein IT568_06735, partial [bacterium]|nr:hypothetical protein [bacterium]